MLGFLAKIIGYSVLILGLIGLVLYFIDLFRFVFSKKGAAPLPWWVFWRS